MLHKPERVGNGPWAQNRLYGMCLADAKTCKCCQVGEGHMLCFCDEWKKDMKYQVVRRGLTSYPKKTYQIVDKQQTVGTNMVLGGVDQVEQNIEGFKVGSFKCISRRDAACGKAPVQLETAAIHIIIANATIPLHTISVKIPRNLCGSRRQFLGGPSGTIDAG